MKTILRIALVVLLASIAAAQQLQQPAPASLQGVVVQSGTNTPLGNTTVELRAASTAGPTSTTLTIPDVLSSVTVLRGASSGALVTSTVTDAEGKFFFPKTPPGSYRLVATGAGYARAEYGQRRPGGPVLTLTLTAGQTMTGVQIPITKGGVISGRLTDGGQPVGIANVHALQASYIEDQRIMTIVMSARTNDLGEYHMFWLPPGEYYVVAEVFDSGNDSRPLVFNPDGDNNSFVALGRFVGARGLRAVLTRSIGAGSKDSEAHLPIYYPNTPDPKNAQSIQIKAGEERRNVDIDSSPLPLRHVRGFVTPPPPPNPDGRPTLPLEVNMLPLTPVFGTLGGGPSSEAAANGAFDIPRVIPGTYVLYANPIDNLMGRKTIVVGDRDLDNVQIDRAPGLSISGQLVIETQLTSGPILTLLRSVTLRTVDPVIPGHPTYTGNSVPANGSLAIPTQLPAPTAPTAATAAAEAANAALFAALGIDAAEMQNLTTAFASRTPPGPPVGNYRVSVSPILMPPTGDGFTPPIPAALQNAYVKSIRLGDADVLNDGLHLKGRTEDKLVIVIGTNPGSLDGRVLDDRKQPAQAVWVALIPDSGLRFHVDHKFTSTDSEGRFQLQGLPPGDYKVFAWEDAQKGAWQNPGFVRDYESRATPVHIDEGGKATVEVTSFPPRN